MEFEQQSLYVWVVVGCGFDLEDQEEELSVETSVFSDPAKATIFTAKQEREVPHYHWMIHKLKVQ